MKFGVIEFKNCQFNIKFSFSANSVLRFKLSNVRSDLFDFLFTK